MDKPFFSVVLIARNEAKTLPRLLSSLVEFKARGGQVCLLDTGSTDDTVKLAQDWGCRVEAVGDKFLATIDEQLAKTINKKFVAEGEEPIVKVGDTLFDYSAARNYAAIMADNNTIATPDCDEVYTKFDIDKINQAIRDGAEQLEYNFVFSHDQYGKEAVKFLHCKFYNRKKLKWAGIVHEVLQGNAKRVFLDESIIKLEHWQSPSPHRSRYLTGLALDCHVNPTNDRNSHYFGRELLWTGRPKSAIRELERHRTLSHWVAERAQSLVFMGRAYATIGEDSKAIECWHQAVTEDPGRREALVTLADYYWKKNSPQHAAIYAAAALTVPWSTYFANLMEHYTWMPHKLLGWALPWIGDREGGRIHFDLALKDIPDDHEMLSHWPFHHWNPKVSIVIPTLGRKDKLKRLLELIPQMANYENYEILVMPDSFKDRKGVPTMLKRGVAKSTGELVMYLGNDCVPQQNFLINAVKKMYETWGEAGGLVALNDGYWHGEFPTHWLGHKNLLPYLDGEFFHTGYYHNGCDNELGARCEKIGKYVWAEDAKVYHNHPIQPDWKEPLDEVHKIVQDEVRWKHDRELLEARSKLLGFKFGKNFTHPDMKLSIVIPVKNKLALTSAMLASLRMHTPSLGQVILVDDHSTEDFTKLEGIEYHLNEGEGVCAAWNTGAKYATFPYIAFLNNDILLTPNWDISLIQALNNEVWVVSPYHTAGEVPFAGEKHTNMTGQPTGIPILGSCFMMTKETWQHIGPIDSRLNLWCGDNYIYESVINDFGRQCKEIPDSLIHHFVSQTLDRSKVEDILTQDKATFDTIYGERGWGKAEYPWIPKELDLRLRLPTKDLPKMNVLNVGVGDGDSGLARQLPFLKFGGLAHIDTHQPYLDNAKAKTWYAKQVQFGKQDVREAELNNYDLVMIFDVIEHIPKVDGLKLLASLKTKLLLFVPLETEFRQNDTDVKEQDHLSFWTEEEFKALGFKTERLPLFHREGDRRFDALWVWNY